MKVKSLVVWCLAIAVSSTVNAETGIQADFSNSGMQVVGKNTIRVRNMQVTGYGNYYVDFQWNPDTATLTPVRADKDVLPNLAVTAKRYSAAPNSVPDFNQVCVGELGSLYQEADWSQVKSVVGNDPTAMQTFLSTVNATSGTPFFVRYGSQSMNAAGNLFFMVPQGSAGGAVLETLQGTAYVGYTSSTMSAAVLCAKAQVSNPFVK